MPCGAKPASQRAQMPLNDPEFPPLLTGYAVEVSKNPCAEAIASVEAGGYGGGDIFWSRGTDRLRAAIVLEPDVPASRAVEMLPMAMVAFADSFGAIAPPEVGLTFDWPNGLRVNGGVVGAMQLAMAASQVDDVPDWMVVGIDVTIRALRDVTEPGFEPDITTLEAEGCGALDRTQLLESFARHFLVWVHRWEDEGFAPAHASWLGRHHGNDIAIVVTLGPERLEGAMTGLDEHGNLILRRRDGNRLVTIRDWMTANRMGERA